ncbi:AHH domain-containing protein [Aliikangiella sp. IMCC44359]|uniref:AHH domain-containing protein n=1 Tax=Aliikangiella sp. IMCC44359 TaxID=3459125 RepID=UPI00403AC413
MLDHQRMHAFSMADAQAQLDTYRKNVRNANSKTLLQEEHHPTEILELYMRVAGKPKPDCYCTAHHIVPGKGKLKINYLTRVHLHINAIGINDPDNGVYLPKRKADTPHWNMPNSKGHKEYHTHGYELFVNQRVTAKNTEQGIRQTLQMIGKMLQENNLPKQARKM